MTNWGQLQHAYGSAEGVPDLLDRVEAGQADWNELWSALCHQGSVYTASFAALPRLAEIARSEDRDQRIQALALAAAIVARAEQEPEAGDIWQIYATEIASMLELTTQLLPSVPEDDEYALLVETALAFEGQSTRNEALTWLGEYEFECPECDALVYVVIGEDGYFSTTDDTYEGDRIALDSVEPADLDEVWRRVHDSAMTHGHPEFATALTYVFGNATCGECAESFSVIEQWEAKF